MKRPNYIKLRVMTILNQLQKSINYFLFHAKTNKKFEKKLYECSLKSNLIAIKN